MDWLFTPEAEAPPKRRYANPAIPLRDHTYSSFFSVFPGAIRSRRAEKIDSMPKRSLHGVARSIARRSTAQHGASAAGVDPL